jgi:propanol-preferring alcohol dehydrogenase
LIKVLACGVCRTDLHLVDGELPQAVLPRVPGHEIVGEVMAVGSHADLERIGQRVGVPWLGWTCGEFAFCQSDRENLCDQAMFTGCHLDGGYAEYAVADQRFCFPIPEALSNTEAAPLLCAGLMAFAPCKWHKAPATSGFMVLGPQRIWPFKSHGDVASRYTPSLDRATLKVRRMPYP